MLHRESVAMEELGPELREVMDTVIKKCKLHRLVFWKEDFLQNYDRK
jgi:hypothetical protein